MCTHTKSWAVNSMVVCLSAERICRFNIHVIIIMRRFKKSNLVLTIIIIAYNTQFCSSLSCTKEKKQEREREKKNGEKMKERENNLPQYEFIYRMLKRIFPLIGVSSF